MYIVKINPREEILYLLSCVKKTQILQFYRFVKKNSQPLTLTSTQPTFFQSTFSSNRRNRSIGHDNDNHCAVAILRMARCLFSENNIRLRCLSHHVEVPITVYSIQFFFCFARFSSLFLNHMSIIWFCHDISVLDNSTINNLVSRMNAIQAHTHIHSLV